MTPNLKGTPDELSTRTPARQAAPGVWAHRSNLALELSFRSSDEARAFGAWLDESSSIELRAPRAFSWLRWLFLCCAGLRHRHGESWAIVQKGRTLRRVSCCTRCGDRKRGAMTL